MNKQYVNSVEIERLKASLREKTKSLEESNRKLELFRHVVGCDLKGPARRIEALAQFMLEDYGDRLDEDGLQWLTQIRNCAVKLTHLMDDTISLMSIGTGEVPLEEVQLLAVVREVMEGLGSALQGVEIEIDEGLPTVVANRCRLEELFSNLISNAVKFNDKERKLLQIGWEEEDDCYTLYVRDNGPGIEERYWEKIFELFEVLNPNADYESTGAGLAICKRIVEELGGRIWVESVPGRGSTFYFTIPRGSGDLPRRGLRGRPVAEKLRG